MKEIQEQIMRLKQLLTVNIVMLLDGLQASMETVILDLGNGAEQWCFMSWFRTRPQEL